MMFEVVPTKVGFEGAARIVLHESLVVGMRREGAIAAGTQLDAELLDKWADECASPSGGRAMLARSIARFVDAFGGELRPLPSLPGGTFWDAVASM